MSARYLIVILVLLAIVGIAITSRSTLTPLEGVNHVFYAGYSDFMAQEAATGDFNGDGKGDIVTTFLWDDPSTCGAFEYPYTQAQACSLGWSSWTATKSGQPNKTICRFADGPLQDAQRNYWVSCGWTLTVGTCAACIEAQWFNENKGAAFVFKGGDWSSKSHDIDLTTGSGADYMVVGNAGGDMLYNGIGAGEVTVDAYHADELVLGADQERNRGPGEVYVISGNTPAKPWPSMATGQIHVPSSTLVEHYFSGRDSLDEFGKGIVVGDLDGDGDAEIVVAAPFGDGPNNSLTDAGEIYVFYSNSFLPATKDLATLTDADFEGPSGAASQYAQVIWGNLPGDETGVTEIDEWHQAHGHPGDYDPVGLAIGDWNGDGIGDLAIGAGKAESGRGAVYVIYGRAVTNPARKLRPGNKLGLYRRLGFSDAVDVKITGKTGSHLGAGVAFVDADAEGPPGPGGGKDDLLVGAPYVDLGGNPLKGEYYGEVYVIWGATSPPSDSIYVGNSSQVGVRIHGQDMNDQIGGHLAGNFDIDHDGKKDIGIAGHDVSFVLFGRSRSSWESTVDLHTNLSANRGLRVLKWTSNPTPSSMTIRLLDLDGDNYKDLVFGGYDNPGASGEPATIHAGQMWVTRGWDMWKKGTISANTTWSGLVFVDGDITVQSGKTLTIAPGTHVWVWQKDALALGDTSRVEFNIEGALVANGTRTDPIIFESWDWQPQATDDWVGFYFDAQSGGGTFNYCTIKRAEDAIDSYVSLAVRNTTIADCRYAGIDVHGGTALIKDCTFTNPGSFGIFLVSGSTTVRNTTVDNAVSTAIIAQPSATLVARGSSFINSDTGMYVNGVASVSVDSSCVFTGNAIGVNFYQTGTASSLKHSTINSNTTAGVFCNESAPVIRWNTLRYNLAAIHCDHSAYPTVWDNTIKSNTIGMKTSNGSEPDASGNNTFAYTSNKHIINYDDGVTVLARDNCWNVNTSPCAPPANKFFGPVDRENPVCCSVGSGAPESWPAPGPAPRAVTALVAIVPNPFNPTTAIHYSLAAPGGMVTLSVYDVGGRLLKTLVNGQKAPGDHEVVWDGIDRRGSPVASGIYFVRMVAGPETFTRKMVLLK